MTLPGELPRHAGKCLSMLSIDDAVIGVDRTRAPDMSQPALQHLLDIIEGSSQALVVHRGGAPLFVNSAMAKLVGIE